MAIKLNDGTVLRNLEEQVQYLTNYHDVNQGLAQWGIRVVGQVTTEADLPNPDLYEGEYGDTYAVGTEAPFSFYIWTRASIVGDPGYWFPFGEISIVGPQGPQGPQGEQGETGQSTRWYAGSTPGPGSDWDLFLDTVNGNIFQYYNNAWNSIGNIRGPQGIQGRTGAQGPKGEIGPVGPEGPIGPMGKFLNIAGIITNINQLPLPSTLNDLTVAYLLNSGSAYNLWIQVGTDPATAIWTDIGRFNEGTAVYANSAYQPVWDADTKVDKKVVASESILTMKPNGTTDTLSFSLDPKPYYIVRRDANSEIQVPPVPLTINDATSKFYVDGNLNNKLDKDTSATGTFRVYTISDTGAQSTLRYTSAAIASTLTTRNGAGNLLSNEPTLSNEVATKNYVDSNCVKKDTTATGLARAYIITAAGEQGNYPIATTDSSTQPGRLLYLRGAISCGTLEPTATISVQTPVHPYAATNKKYVDDNSLVSVRYTFEILGGTTTLVSYLTLNKNMYNNTEPYEYFIAKDITSAAKGLPAYCEECGVFSTVYWDPANDIFKCAMNPDDEYEMIEMQEM